MTVQQTASPSWMLTIEACGYTDQSSVVCAISVQQPVQSFTVYRSTHDLRMLAQATGQSAPPSTDGCTLVQARDKLEPWLTETVQAARDSAAVRQFLTIGAGMIPAEYSNVEFVTMTAPQQQFAMDDDMNFDEVFYGGEEVEDDGYDDDEEDVVPPAHERYRETNEAFTEEDEMEILDMAAEVEMVEDIGSLAQSLGASHLGRSLHMQAELGQQTKTSLPQQQGLSIGAPSGYGQGGIHQAITSNREATPNAAFNATPMQSASRLDSFQLIRVIGKGSFGKVFLVKEHSTNTVYALKVLKKDNIIKRNQVEHTKTERSVLGYVRHPFIVGMNMAFQSRDKLYFVLDYCAGGELFFHLGKVGKFPEHRARFYAAEIILAISYVHSLDIVYRDLKPENVLLDHEGHIRLTDFGLSKEGISSSSSGANSFCGTPEYLAPEILSRQGHGRAVDWWSLGALLYEMLTSLPPFYCQDRQRLFEKIKTQELPYPPCVTPPAKAVLKGLLTKDPTKRLGSGELDAEEIQKADFFSCIDWTKLAQGESTPPWRPEISGTFDTSQFDREFTSMPFSSPQSPRGYHGFSSNASNDLFQGFTYTNRRFHGPGTAAGI